MDVLGWVEPLGSELADLRRNDCRGVRADHGLLRRRRAHRGRGDTEQGDRRLRDLTVVELHTAGATGDCKVAMPSGDLLDSETRTGVPTPGSARP